MYFYLNQYILLVSLYYFSYVHSYQWNNYPFNPIGGIEQRIVSGMWRKNVEIDNNHSLKDNIQNAAQKEGIYVTNNDTRMHIFSHTEAIQCLSKRNIAIAGDSYMVQLMIGLVDILLNDPSNKEITSGQMRTEVLQQRDSELLSKNFDFRLKYTPEKCRHGGIECLIDYFKNLHASNSTKNKYADVYIVNILVHHIMSLPKADHLSFKKHSLEEFRKSKYSVALESLFMYVIRHDIPMLWLTGPG